VSGLQGNAPKEEKTTPTSAIVASTKQVGQNFHPENHETPPPLDYLEDSQAIGEARNKWRERRHPHQQQHSPAALAARGLAEAPPRTQSRRSGFHAQQDITSCHHAAVHKPLIQRLAHPKAMVSQRHPVDAD
jgi:hypothetical protein